MMATSILFNIVSIFIVFCFIMVFGTIIVSAVQGASRWKKNNHSPVLTVEALVVAKRMDVSHHNHHDQAMNTIHTTSNTLYYVTFQVESGDRMELMVQGEEYGMLVEGDAGRLTFQGTRYKEFKRQ